MNPRREIVWPPGAMDQLAALARRFPEAPTAIVPAVYELADNPRPAGSTRCGGAGTYRRLLLGYFRVLYCVSEDPPLIEVLLVGRSDTAR